MTLLDEHVRRGRGPATVAVLPVGSFEQHGDFLPLATDTVIAMTIAEAVAAAYPVLLLPPGDDLLLTRARGLARHGEHLGADTARDHPGRRGVAAAQAGSASWYW